MNGEPSGERDSSSSEPRAETRALPITRRDFLRTAARAAAAAGSAVALGSTVARWPAGAASEAEARSAAVPWRTLAAALTGHLVQRGDPKFQADAQLYNERFDGIRPAAIAYCASTEDVRRCVDFARHRGVRVAARSGGHSYGGYSACRGLVIDVTQMSEVRVAPSSGRATVGAGARLIDIYNTLGSHGVLLPGGSCPTVGIAGLALGGGVGVFARRYGLTCDQLVSLRIVTADGRLLTCDRSHNENLFWACQGGGGGNFGIVTSFEFDVHPIPPIALFTLVWPWSVADAALGAWLEWTGAAPDEVWSNCQLLSSGAAGGANPTTVRVTGVFCGAAKTLTAFLVPLRAAVGAAPLYDFVGTEEYLRAMLIEAGCEGETVAACHLPNQDPTGTLSRAAFTAKSAYVTSVLPDGGLAAAVDSVASLADEVPEVGGGLVFDAYGGAVARVAPHATAFCHRDALAGVQWSFSWETGGAPAAVIGSGTSWLDTTAQRLSPYVSGAYVNYIDPTLVDWQSAYYGTNLRRLVRVKRAVDPDDFFHFAQSVPTRLPRLYG